MSTLCILTDATFWTLKKKRTTVNKYIKVFKKWTCIVKDLKSIPYTVDHCYSWYAEAAWTEMFTQHFYKCLAVGVNPIHILLLRRTLSSRHHILSHVTLNFDPIKIQTHDPLIHKQSIYCLTPQDFSSHITLIRNYSRMYKCKLFRWVWRNPFKTVK